ncbi:PLP-dependent transferase [Ascobolus immersus RN42]|uniref:PLP-dependent transferase n=1 Tax=Ascobolus immersus RN42 TaxID=1160509 RepID=A0A3N4HKD3_ASCIM|nr:PLP-dependent transferase [Ascobolus immersus RN42]
MASSVNSNGQVHPFANISDITLESTNHLKTLYANDASPTKVNLMVGVYRTPEGKPYLFPSVQAAKQRIFADNSWNFEYPSLQIGSKSFRQEGIRGIFGEGWDDRVIATQTNGASGAVHWAGVFLKEHYGPWKDRPDTEKKIYIPEQTWINHHHTFHHLHITTSTLPYLSTTTTPGIAPLDFSAFHTAISNLPPQSVILLQPIAHNPTGLVPTASQWTTLLRTIKKLGHFIIWDVAYPGFSSGNIFDDLAVVREYAEAEVPMVVCWTYGKCMGVYSERVGLLLIPMPAGASKEMRVRIEKQVKGIVRAETGALGGFGGRLVETVLADAGLKKQWEGELRTVAGELVRRREKLGASLERLGAKGDWKGLVEGRGFFALLNLTEVQVAMLREKWSVYVLESGRLSIAGLNDGNVEYVARAIHDVLENTRT